MSEHADKWPKKPLTIYLGESGKPLDSKRVDIITEDELVVSVDVNGVSIGWLRDEGKTIREVKFNELQEETI